MKSISNSTYIYIYILKQKKQQGKIKHTLKQIEGDELPCTLERRLDSAECKLGQPGCPNGVSFTRNLGEVLMGVRQNEITRNWQRRF